MTQTALNAGGQLGDFRLIKRIALGGMAEVWAAHDTRPKGQRTLALKVMRATFAEDSGFHEMFHDEVHLSMRLRHENIVEVYGGTEIEGYLVQEMELIAGLDLRRTMVRLKKKRWRFPIPLLVYVGRCIARALAYAHMKRGPRGQPLNIVHRDISPHNVMLAFDGRVKVLDFGIAKAAERLTHTRGGVIKGKTAYMAPEQVVAAALDHRTDIFASGIVLWEAFTGERLFRANGDQATMELVLRGDVPRIERARPDVPPEVAELIHAMLAHRPRDRPQSMLEVERALQRTLVRRFEVEEAGAQALADWLGRVAADDGKAKGTAVLPPLPAEGDGAGEPGPARRGGRSMAPAGRTTDPAAATLRDLRQLRSSGDPEDEP